MAKNKALKKPDVGVATQANKLVEASYKMSIPAKRVMLMLLAQIHPGQRDVSKKVRIEAADYAEKTGVDFSQSYKDIKTGCRELMRTIISMKKVKTTEECVVVSWMEYHESEGWLEASFTSWIAPYIHYLARIGYTTINIDKALRFKRFYSVRLYEMVMQFKETGVLHITTDNLRKGFHIQAKQYPRFADLKRRVLNPSLKEINEKTDWVVAYEVKKKGGKVNSVSFTFKQDDQQDIFKAADRH